MLLFNALRMRCFACRSADSLSRHIGLKQPKTVLAGVAYTRFFKAFLGTKFVLAIRALHERCFINSM